MKTTQLTKLSLLVNIPPLETIRTREFPDLKQTNTINILNMSSTASNNTECDVSFSVWNFYVTPFTYFLDRTVTNLPATPPLLCTWRHTTVTIRKLDLYSCKWSICVLKLNGPVFKRFLPFYFRSSFWMIRLV
jgi:hypothetical protein